MARKGSGIPSISLPLHLGENPVNNFQARIYAQESSPSIIAVCLELTENARDNATEVTLTVDVEASEQRGGIHYLTPKRIVCEDNGTGLTHAEFLNRFCGAFSDSDVHREVDRAGRNGVGTKTYTSIADRVIVTTTTARPTEGLAALVPGSDTSHRDELQKTVPNDLKIPGDGDPDTVWRAYEFRLHSRSALPHLWTPASPMEMGTRVELVGIFKGTEVPWEVLLERLSYRARVVAEQCPHIYSAVNWQFAANFSDCEENHTATVGSAHENWLIEAKGSSAQDLTIFDPTTKEPVTIPAAAGLPEPIEFDFRVVGRANDGQMQNLDKPALLLEICGALPYAPSLEGVLSARTLPLLTFLGLEHASSIGAFCNAVCGYGRVNSLALKDALRNNKTTLASGPGMEAVEVLRTYLHSIFRVLHRAWYNATRSQPG